jgi:hypothetical protein
MIQDIVQETCILWGALGNWFRMRRDVVGGWESAKQDFDVIHDALSPI